MFSAPTRSAWSVYPQRTHWNFSCVGRFSSATCPQGLRGQVREVLRGFTGISLRPALSALCARMPRNTPQPASWMLLFTPAFAPAPFGRNAPALPGSGLGCGARTMFAMLNRSCAITSYSLTIARAVLCAWSCRWRRTLRCDSAKDAELLVLRFPTELIEALYDGRHWSRWCLAQL